MTDEETPAQVCAREGHQPPEEVWDYNVRPPKVIGKKCPRCGAAL